MKKQLNKLSVNESKMSAVKIFDRTEPDVCSEHGEENCDCDSPMTSKSYYKKLRMEENLAEMFDLQNPEE